MRRFFFLNICVSRRVKMAARFRCRAGCEVGGKGVLGVGDDVFIIFIWFVLVVYIISTY